MPAVRRNSVGASWAGGATPGSSIRIEKFFIAQPTDSAATINRALGTGKNLILTPGIYHLDQSIEVTRPDTVELGLGFPTLIPYNDSGKPTPRTTASGRVTSMLCASIRRAHL